MHITLLSLRQKRQDPFAPLIELYRKKTHLWPLKNHEILHKAGADRTTTSTKLLGQIGSEDYVILLDETGKSVSSQGFTDLLQGFMVQGQKNVTFVIGGPEGVNGALKGRANFCLSFGTATWPHKMVLLMVMEQLYRAQQIINNHPYHKE